MALYGTVLTVAMAQRGTRQMAGQWSLHPHRQALSMPEPCQARIQHFAQGGATAKRGPEAIGPKVPPSKTKKSADLIFYFLVGAILHL